MFNSGISVKELIDELISEVDIALDIPNATYISWLNSLQQLIYTEIIKEQRKKAVETNNDNLIDLSLIDTGTGENRLYFEDIHAVYAGKTQLKKSTVASGFILSDTYYKENNNIGYNTKKTPLTIIYFVKPALVTKENYEKAEVMFPIEFIDLARAKLRGEAYKLANEDNLAAKWLNDYNILLENFKAWIAEKAPDFGL